jgi:branched-chain amino acid transport system permease protein
MRARSATVRSAAAAPAGAVARLARGAERALAPRACALPDGRWRPLELAFWLAPVLWTLALPSWRLLASQVFVTCLFALSLDLVLGFAGIVSLGQAAFFGTGAYAAGLLAAHGWGEPLSGLAAAAAAAGLLAWLTSFLVVRAAGLGRLMVTLGIGLLCYEAANRAAPVTGGVDGLTGVTMWPLLGRFDFDLLGSTACAYALIVLFAVFVLLRRLAASPFGLSLRAVRQNPARTAALGAPVQRRLRAAFTLGGAIAGLAGGLLAQTTQFVGLDYLSFPRSADLLVMVVLGGTGRLYGALVGATLFMLAQDRLSGLDPTYWQLWLGLVLVAAVLFARGGVLGGLERLRRAIVRRFARGARM